MIEAVTFTTKLRDWVQTGDTIYGPQFSELTLPLEHPYLFECDKPMGHYQW